jgi:uncharacterized membrane protein YjgN (DUF898 family)
MKIEYRNSSWELLWKIILWGLAIFFTFGLALPWVINSSLSYFSNGFVIKVE